MAKKDADIKRLRTELMKAQAYLMEYLMKEEECVRETEKAKEKVETMRKSHGNAKK